MGLTFYSYRTIYLSNGSGKEGTMCTAFSYCRFHQQRLRGFGTYAPKSSGSFGFGPWALRPKRLQWLTNIGTGFKIAAFPVLPVVRDFSLPTVMPAQAGIQLLPRQTRRKLDPGLPRGDGVKRGRAAPSNISRALPQFFFHLRILIGRKAMAETSPPFLSLGDSMR